MLGFTNYSFKLKLFRLTRLFDVMQIGCNKAELTNIYDKFKQFNGGLTEQSRSCCVLRFATGSRESLGCVTAAVVQAQLLTRGLGGHQLLRHLLLSATFLTPQLVTVLPQWKAVGDTNVKLT